MAGNIRIGFKRNGRIVSVTDFVHNRQFGGVVLDGESSAFPRGIELGISGTNAGTKAQLNTVRMRHGWQRNREFKVPCLAWADVCR